MCLYILFEMLPCRDRIALAAYVNHLQEEPKKPGHHTDMAWLHINRTLSSSGVSVELWLYIYK